MVSETNRKSGVRIRICSDIDYENLIAEIVFDGKFIGFVTNEPNKGFRFEIPGGQVSSVSIELCILVEAFEKAKKELLK